MTMDKANKMIQKRLDISEDNIQEVLKAVKACGNCQPKDIEKHLQYKKREEIQQNEWRNNNMNILPKVELEAKVKKETMSMRTILRKLDHLEKEGYIDNENSRYSIKDDLKEEIRLFAPQFGSSALANMMQGHYPLFNTLEQNLEKLIKIFGVYVIYCFAEAARPAHSTTLVRDKLASFWIQNVFSPLNMYDYFLAVVNNQPKNNKVERTLRKNFKFKHGSRYVDDDGKVVRPSSTQQFALERFRRLTTQFEYNKYKSDGKPLYELDTKIIEKIFNILEKKYSYQFEPLLETSSYFTRGLKEEAVDRVRKRKESKERSKPKT
jgi:hypothetical protein